MRALVFLLLVAPAAHAQPALFRGTPNAVPHWRASVDVGVSGALSLVVSAEAERTVTGPFAAGARGIAYTRAGVAIDDGGGIVGSAAELFVSAGLHRRVADLRVFAGTGVSLVRSYSSGLVEPGVREPASDARAVRPHLVSGLSVDLYPLPGIGVGGTVRVAASATAVPLTTGSLGLRLRLAR